MYRVVWTSEGATRTSLVANAEQAEYLRRAILRSDPAATVTVEPA